MSDERSRMRRHWALGHVEDSAGEPTPDDDAAAPVTDLESCVVRHAREPDPGYALMVDGEWGVGKTYQVRRALDSRGIKYVYLSLAGIASVGELNSAIMVACQPKREKALGLSSWFVSRAPGGLFGGMLREYATLGVDLVSVLARANVRPEGLLVLDDLERCSIGIQDVVGVINDLIEHKGARVVLIGSSSEMAREQSKSGEARGGDFERIREKIVGRTVVAKPNVENALRSFLDNLSVNGGFPIPLDNHASTVHDVFVHSGYRSLRVLRSAVRDAATYLSCWRPEYLEHDQMVSDALREFLPFCMSHHHRALPNGLLANHVSVYWEVARSLRSSLRRDDAAEEPSENAGRVLELESRFGGEPFTRDLIGGELLERMIVDGRFDAAEIRERLDVIPPFSTPEDRPEWLTIIYFQRTDPSAVQLAVNRLRGGLTSLGYTTPGELLHCTAVRLFLAKLDELSESSDEVVDEACEYIDRLAADGLLAPARADPHDPDEQRKEFAGFSYLVEKDYALAFRQVCDHLQQARRSVLEASYLSIVEQILQTLHREGLDPSRNPLQGSVEQTRTVQMNPVFQAANPDRFVQAWMASPVPTWLSTREWLSRRYRRKTDRGGVPFEAERAFAAGVVDRLRQESDARSGLDRRRLEELVPTIEMLAGDAPRADEV